MANHKLDFSFWLYTRELSEARTIIDICAKAPQLIFLTMYTCESHSVAMYTCGNLISTLDIQIMKHPLTVLLKGPLWVEF